MKKMVFMSMILSVLFLTACPMEDNRSTITVDNNSGYNISFYFSSYFSEKYGDTIYPDTTLGINMNGRRPYVIPMGKFILFEEPPLEDLYKMDHTDTLCLFIFATDTLKKYDWNTIRQDYKILQRYDLSLQDFKRLKYTISYPPSASMKDIKMYPSYKQ